MPMTSHGVCQISEEGYGEKSEIAIERLQKFDFLSSSLVVSAN